MDALAIQQMPLDEARGLHERILKGYKHKGATDTAIRHLIYAYDRGSGWAAMGYKNMWKAFEGRLKHEYDIGASMMYKLIKQATAEDQLGILPEAIGGDSTGTRSRKHVLNLSGRALSQLAKLNAQPEDQKKAFEKARLRAGINPINEKLVRDAVKPFLTPPNPRDPKPKSAKEPFQRITMAERSFKIVRDLKHVIDECQRLNAPKEAVTRLELALTDLEPWKDDHQ